jgi:hypothetical protein
MRRYCSPVSGWIADRTSGVVDASIVVQTLEQDPEDPSAWISSGGQDELGSADDRNQHPPSSGFGQRADMPFRPVTRSCSPEPRIETPYTNWPDIILPYGQADHMHCERSGVLATKKGCPDSDSRSGWTIERKRLVACSTAPSF